MASRALALACYAVRACEAYAAVDDHVVRKKSRIVWRQRMLLSSPHLLTLNELSPHKSGVDARFQRCSKLQMVLDLIKRSLYPSRPSIEPRGQLYMPVDGYDASCGNEHCETRVQGEVDESRVVEDGRAGSLCERAIQSLLLAAIVFVAAFAAINMTMQRGPPACNDNDLQRDTLHNAVHVIPAPGTSTILDIEHSMAAGTVT